jgi:hypothetical protein
MVMTCWTQPNLTIPDTDNKTGARQENEAIIKHTEVFTETKDTCSRKCQKQTKLTKTAT